MILNKFKGLRVAIIIRLIKIFKREKGMRSFSSTNRLHCCTDNIAPNAFLNYSGKCQQLVWATGDSKDGRCTSFSPCTSCTSHLVFQPAFLAELVGSASVYDSAVGKMILSALFWERFDCIR